MTEDVINTEVSVVVINKDTTIKRIGSSEIKNISDTEIILYNEKKYYVTKRNTLLHDIHKVEYYEDGFDVDLYENKLNVLNIFQKIYFKGLFIKDIKSIFDLYLKFDNKFQYSEDDIQYLYSIYSGDINKIINFASVEYKDDNDYSLTTFSGCIYMIKYNETKWYLYANNINGDVTIFDNFYQYYNFARKLEDFFKTVDSIPSEYSGVVLNESIISSTKSQITIDLNSDELKRESLINDFAIENEHFGKKIVVGDKSYWIIMSSSLLRDVKLNSIIEDENKIILDIVLNSGDVISEYISNILINDFEKAFKIIPDGNKIYILNI